MSIESVLQRLSAITPGKWRFFSRNGVNSVLSDAAPRKEVINWTGFDTSDFPTDAPANAFAASRVPELVAIARAAAGLRQAMTARSHSKSLIEIEAGCRNVDAALHALTERGLLD